MLIHIEDIDYKDGYGIAAEIDIDYHIGKYYFGEDEVGQVEIDNAEFTYKDLCVCDEDGIECEYTEDEITEFLKTNHSYLLIELIENELEKEAQYDF